MKQKEFGQKALLIEDNSYVSIKNKQNNRYLVIDEFGFENWVDGQQIRLIEDENIYQNIRKTSKDEAPKNKIKRFEKEFFTIDLHAEKLQNLIKTHPKWPLLDLKIMYCEQQIDYAIKNRLSKIKIIHGMGDGILQNAVYALLDCQSGLEYDKEGFFKESMAYVLVYLS